MNGHAPVAPTTMKPHDCGCGCGGSCGSDRRCGHHQSLVPPNIYCRHKLTHADIKDLREYERDENGGCQHARGCS